MLHAGDRSNPALKEYLALGARSVEVLEIDTTPELQADATAPLAARLRGYDLVLTGTRAEGAFDSGMLPYRVANALEMPLVGAAVEITLRDGCAEVRQFMPKGLRRRVEVRLPALIAVHPLASAAPTYAYARLREGTIRPVATPAAANPDDLTGPCARPAPNRCASPRPRSAPATPACSRRRRPKAVVAAS